MTKRPLVGLTTKLQLPPHSGGRLSPTQIGMYQRCSRQYFWRYVEGVKVPPAVVLVEGSSHHATLEFNNNYKKRTGKDKGVKALVNRFSDQFSDRSKKIEDWEGESKDTVINRGRFILRGYHDHFASRLQPRYVEERISLQVGEVPVVGIIDVIGTVRASLFAKTEGPLAAVDYKVTSRKKPQAEVDSSVQLTTYGWGAGQLCAARKILVGFYILKRGGRQEWQPGVVTPARIRWLRSIVLSVADGISRGSFPVCDPASWVCSKRFCGYWGRCRGSA